MRRLSEEVVRMYIVKWCDCEGNLHERKFRTIRAAHAEAEELRKRFDYVGVVPEERGAYG